MANKTREQREKEQAEQNAATIDNTKDMIPGAENLQMSVNDPRPGEEDEKRLSVDRDPEVGPDHIQPDTMAKKLEAEAEKTGKKKYKVAKGQKFADINDFNKKWNDGDDVSHFDQARLDNLEERGLVTGK